MLAAARYLHVLHGTEPTEVIDIAVTCDGTWSKRGFTATYGIVVVISWESGQVLDYEILSKRCNACERQKTRWGEDSEQYVKWMEGHRTKCAINHEGSSPAMECAGVLKIWNRSVLKYHLRYTQMISDGDCKSLTHLNQHQPYGDVAIIKHECVGHVQKRVTPKLKLARTLFKRDRVDAKKKEKTLKDKIKEVKQQYGCRRRGTKKGTGKDKIVGEQREGEKKLKILENELENVKVPEGKLLDDMIHILQQYYGNAIRGNTGDLENMTDACWAVFYHSLSTDDNPCHYCCPKGKESWCKFQRAVANGEDTPRHHTTISADYKDYLEPQWRSLCSPKLLEKCLLGATQNRNESFNALVWARAPKTEYCGLDTIQATGQAVIVFNSGKQALVKLMDQLGIPVGPLCTSYLKAEDYERIKRSESKMEVVTKKRRQTLHLRDKRTEQEHIDEEGTTYLAGNF